MRQLPSPIIYRFDYLDILNAARLTPSIVIDKSYSYSYSYSHSYRQLQLQLQPTTPA